MRIEGSQGVSPPLPNGTGISSAYGFPVCSRRWAGSGRCSEMFGGNIPAAQSLQIRSPSYGSPTASCSSPRGSLRCSYFQLLALQCRLGQGLSPCCSSPPSGARARLSSAAARFKGLPANTLEAFCGLCRYAWGQSHSGDSVEKRPQSGHYHSALLLKSAAVLIISTRKGIT